MAWIHQSLGVHYMMQRRVDDAVPEYERALALLEASAGADALATVGPLTDLGRAYIYVERLDDARRVQQRALRILEAEELDDDDERYASLLLGQAELDQNTERCGDHDAAMDRALEIAEDARGGADAIVDRALSARLHCMQILGQLQDAEATAQRLVASVDSKRPHSLGTAYQMLASLELSMERYEDALHSAETGLLVLAAARLAHEPIGSKLHVLRGEALVEIERRPEAIAAARRALLPLPQGDYRTLVREFRLGQLLAADGQVDEATMWLQKVEPDLNGDPVQHADRLTWLSDWRRKHP